MKRYVKSSEEFSTEELKDSCFEEVMEYITQNMDDGEYFSYDDVVSDVYAGIQDYFYKMDIELDDITEDEIYENVMDVLDSEGFIDHKRGILLYGD